MNRDEFSKATGIHPETLRKYERDFLIEIPRDEKNNRIYGLKETDTFLMLKKALETKSVKELKIELGIIDKNIESNTPNKNEVVQEKNTGVQSDCISDEIKELSEIVQVVYTDVQQLKNTDIQEIKSNFLQVNETAFSELSIMAKRISELSYQLGNFESSLKYEKEKYQDLILKYDSEKRMISDFSSKSIDELKISLSNKDNLINEKDYKLKEKDKEIEELKKALEKEKSKSIFQKVFSKGA